MIAERGKTYGGMFHKRLYRRSKGKSTGGKVWEEPVRIDKRIRGDRFGRAGRKNCRLPEWGRDGIQGGVEQ